MPVSATCENCGERLVKSFGTWLHDRQDATLASLIYCHPNTDNLDKATSNTKG